MNIGDTVKVKPQFHRPSRIGQFATIITSRSVGDTHPGIQHWIRYQNYEYGQDWIMEYDLELIEESHEFDKVIEELDDSYPNITEKLESYLIIERDGKKVLNL